MNFCGFLIAVERFVVTSRPGLIVVIGMVVLVSREFIFGTPDLFSVCGAMGVADMVRRRLWHLYVKPYCPECGYHIRLCFNQQCQGE